MVVVFRMLAVFLSLSLILSFGSIKLCADEDNGDVYSVIRNGFYCFSESIDISAFGISPESLVEVISSVIKDDPYLFFVNGQLSYSYRPGGCVLSLSPTYNLVGENAFKAWEVCRIKVREMAAEAMRYGGEESRALFIHDEICRLYRYDDELEGDSMYSFFVSGKGTCQAYTQLYTAVLRECGIEAHFVASDTIDHMWNYVKINGEWYHVDLTWDDSASSGTFVSRRHFLCSDTVARERGHRDWYSVIEVECKSERFNEIDFDDFYHVLGVLGDSDHNGRVDLSDLLQLRGHIDFDIAINCTFCADADLDGNITLTDAYLIRKKLLGID